MTFEEIKALIQLVNKSDLAEFVFEDGEQRVVIRTSKYSKGVKGGMPMTHNTYLQPQPPQPTASAPVSVHPGHEQETVALKKEEQQVQATLPSVVVVVPSSNLLAIKSPMVGTFYRSSSPDKPALAKIGDIVNVGSPVCIIEAMKLFNEIESEVKGKIVKVLVTDASPVEYDQVLFMVEPVA